MVIMLKKLDAFLDMQEKTQAVVFYKVIPIVDEENVVYELQMYIVDGEVYGMVLVGPNKEEIGRFLEQKFREYREIDEIEA